MTNEPYDVCMICRDKSKPRMEIKFGSWDRRRNSECPTFRVVCSVYVEPKAFMQEVEKLFEKTGFCAKCGYPKTAHSACDFKPHVFVESYKVKE